MQFHCLFCEVYIKGGVDGIAVPQLWVLVVMQARVTELWVMVGNTAWCVSLAGVDF
jgi:hypothetical protein